MIVLSIQTGLPSGLPAILDMDDEQTEALSAAIRQINRQRHNRKG